MLRLFLAGLMLSRYKGFYHVDSAADTGKPITLYHAERFFNI